MAAVAAMHRHVQERTGEQDEEREISEQMHPVLAEEEIGEPRSDSGDGEPAKQAA